MRFLRRIAVWSLVWLVFVPPAFATNYTVREILPSSPAHDMLAKQVQDALIGRLAEKINEAADKGECDASLIDTSDAIDKARETEQMLRDKGYSDPARGGDIQPSRVDSFIDGVVGTSNGEVDYILDVVDASGKTIAKLEGSFPEGDVGSGMEKAAQDLFSQLCGKHAYRVAGGKSDMQINQQVCDITKPFTLHGSGKTAGIVLALTPAGDSGGSFTVSGTAGGVPWSGGGSYTLSATPKGGTLTLDGTWTITSPVGRFSNAGSIPTTLTPLEKCDPTADAAPPPKPGKKKKKG